MIKTRIYFINDWQNKRFYFFEDSFKANAKQIELGYVERPNLLKDLQSRGLNIETMKIPRCLVESIVLKNYSGTVWRHYKYVENGHCVFTLAGRQKDLRELSEGEKELKFVITPYKEYMARLRGENEPTEDQKKALQDTLKRIDDNDVTNIFKKTALP